MRGMLALALATLLDGACRQTIGVDPYFNAPEDAGDTTRVCGLPNSTAKCDSCIHANCCALASACAADCSCAASVGCLSACAIHDWACRSQCRIDHPVRQSATYAPVVACAVAKCENECGLTCGAIGPAVAPPSAAAACQSCLATVDCAGTLACASSIDCVGAGQCGSDIEVNPPACSFGNGGGPFFSPVVQDISSCSVACASGNDWACVGRVGWPPATGVATTLTFGAAVDYVTSQPLAGVKVSVCRYQDPTCMPPLAQALTDATGNVSLPVPTQPAGVGLDANSYLEASKAGYVTTLFFWGYPVRAPQQSVGTYLYLITTAEAQQLFAQHGVTWDDASQGFIAGYVWDCSGTGGPGVRVALEASNGSTPEFYGQTFDFKATQTTDSSGIFGFVNVPPGAVTVSETPVALKTPAGRQTVLVRSGTLTSLYLRPTP